MRVLRYLHLLLSSAKDAELWLHGSKLPCTEMLWGSFFIRPKHLVPTNWTSCQYTESFGTHFWSYLPPTCQIVVEEEKMPLLPNPVVRVQKSSTLSQRGLDENWSISIQLIRSDIVTTDAKAFSNAIMVQKMETKDVLRFLFGATNLQCHGIFQGKLLGRSFAYWTRA